jgi:hypothetical protein
MMDAAALYTLIVCIGAHQPCGQFVTPFGREPSLTRRDCLEHSMGIRALDHSMRVICLAPDHMGGSYRPDDVIDSAGILRPEYPIAPKGE